jgi:hypothetical protein
VQFVDDLRACGFAIGAARYSDHLAGYTVAAQIVLPVRVGGIFTTQAVVDTGSTWCILNPDIVAFLSGTVEETYTPAESLVIRGTRYQGRLVRVEIRFQAEVGEDLEVEATAFVPTLAPGEVWGVPDFIGLEGCLQRVRFAVDPGENVFYYGRA